MLKEDRIIDAPNLEELEDYYELLESLDERYKNTTKKYFIFRLLDQVKLNILESVCNDLDWDCLNHNSDERIDEIDTLMKTPPSKNTIIFIKGYWRASKRIYNMNHIGGTYEPIPKNRNSSGTAQSNPGRFCDNYGYSGDQLDVNLRPLHYCDKTSIEEYLEWFNKGCDFSTSKYSSKRISSDGKGKVSSKPTKVNSKIVGGIDDGSDEVKVDEIEEPTDIIKRTNFAKIKEWFNENLKTKGYGIGPKQKIKDENGFYRCITQFDKVEKIRTKEEFEDYENKKKWGFRGSTEKSKEKNKYRVYPVYDDVNDVNTLVWWLVYY